MELTLSELSELLLVQESTLLQWVKDRRIPFHQVGRQYFFYRHEINEWILRSEKKLAPRLLDLSISGRVTRLACLLEQGGVHARAAGSSVEEVLHNAIEVLRVPHGLSSTELLAALVDREGMMSTAVGHGIAIPHPRYPIVADIEDACVAICYLETPVDYGALDGLPVHTLFVVLSHNPRRHLEVVAKISYLCQETRFVHMLECHAEAEEILRYVREQEEKWRKKEPK